MRARTTATLAALTIVTLTGSALAVSPALAAPAAATAASVTADGLTTPAGFVPMSPTRVLDTRTDLTPYHSPRTPLGPGEQYSAVVVGNTSDLIPHEATAVVLNVTATNPTATGFLALGAPNVPGSAPSTSSLNFKAGQTVSNLVTVPLSQDSVRPATTIFNSAGTTDVVLDVVGYYLPGAPAKYAPTAPVRVGDTRTDNVRFGPGTVRSYRVAQPDLGTADARAVVLNVTAVNGTAPSFLTAFPSGSPRPAQGSNVNFPAGRTVGNQVVVPVGPDGEVSIYNNAGSVDVVVDVVGSYGPSGKGLFSALKVPVRSLDTRVTGGKLLPMLAREVGAVPVDGSVPNVMGVEANITATDVLDYGHLTVFRGPGSAPNTSTVNVEPGQTVANSATTPVTVDGTYSVFNHDPAPLNLIADVTGYFVTG
ncbi:hypothetical protein ACFRMQ_01785 [Kitasatospora sp. NPDC056783]|uniref:hypothetical protein n=1 Tax=Kitasatospora sp. NPDC056783 TaxID=3345943 RepID=UPI0036A7B6E2